MWSSLFGGDGKSFRSTFSADRFGNVFFSGEWNGVVDPTTYPLVYAGGTTYTASFMGFEDLYVAKFTNNPPAQSFTYPTMCSSDTLVLPKLQQGFLAGGYFKGRQGFTVDSLTGRIDATNVAGGTYTVDYIVQPCYCIGAHTVAGSATVGVVLAPQVTVSGKTVICAGDKVNLTASGGSGLFHWSTGATTSTIAFSSAVPIVTVISVSSTVTSECTSTASHTLTVNNCASINDQTGSQLPLRVFPNPNNGQFTISAPENSEYQLVNELGQLIRTLRFDDRNQRTVVVSDLDRGTYFVRAVEGNSAEKFKIIVE